jgi:hypothetical protein
MENEELDNLESSNQDLDEGADKESKDTSDEDDKRYLNQKVRAEKAEQAKKLAEEKAKLLEQELAKRNDNNPQLSDELKLIARGLSDEEIEKAKVIARGNNITLQEALKDDMFISYQNKLREDKKKEEAKLGASKGSGESQEESEIKPDMTREEHQKIVEKVMGSK